MILTLVFSGLLADICWADRVGPLWGGSNHNRHQVKAPTEFGYRYASSPSFIVKSQSPSPQSRQGRQGYRDYHYSDYNSGDHLEDLWHTPQGNGEGFLGKLKGLGDRQDIAGIPTPLIAIGALGLGAVGYAVITDNRIDGLSTRNDQLNERIDGQENAINNIQGSVLTLARTVSEQENKIKRLENVSDGGVVTVTTPPPTTTTTTSGATTARTTSPTSATTATTTTSTTTTTTSEDITTATSSEDSSESPSSDETQDNEESVSGNEDDEDEYDYDEYSEDGTSRVFKRNNFWKGMLKRLQN